MKDKNIPVHCFSDNNFFMIDRIEDSEEIRYSKTHRHNFYEILWFTEVKNDEVHWVDFEQKVICLNQICILSPGQLHKIEFGSKKGYIVAFSPDFFRYILGVSVELFVKPYCSIGILPDSTAMILKNLLYLMEMEYKTEKRRKLLEAYSSAFLIHIQSIFTESNPNNHSSRIGTILLLIEKYFKLEKEVKFYAHEVSLSIRRINEVSISCIGLTIKQLITQRLITEAKRLIYIEDLSIKEIAYNLGYNDSTYFSRIFKKKTGFTPEEFRNMQLGH